MKEEEKAKELVEKFKDYVHGYVGSSMLTNQEYPEQILSQAKKCAIIAVNEILNNFGLTANGKMFYTEYRAIEFWQEVKKEIEKL